MSDIYQIPPMLQGSAENQLRQLRDYLVRLVREMPGRGDEGQVTLAVKQATAIAAKQNADSTAAAMQRAQQLKDLIIKTADEVYEVTDSIKATLSSEYVAISDYGNYYEDIRQSVEETARGTVESYEYSEGVTLLDQIGNTAQTLEEYMTVLNGQIRRGVILDGDTPTLGIVISQNLQFTGTSRTGPDGETYYDLKTGQTVGIYTSTGWQYWVDGVKVGWFESGSSMLHVANIVVEDVLQMGTGWQWSVSSDMLGLRYIGS